VCCEVSLAFLDVLLHLEEAFFQAPVYPYELARTELKAKDNCPRQGRHRRPRVELLQVKPVAPVTRAIQETRRNTLSGELERLAAKAEMAPIFRTGGGLLRTPEGKQLQTDLRDLARRGIVAKAEVAVKTDVAKDVMDGVAEVDAYRRTLAGGDELLNQALAQVEVTYLRSVTQTQRKVDGNMYGL
jgi:hypothetical protein